MTDALIFDLDDTLCPERPFVLARLEAVAKRLADLYGPYHDFYDQLVRCYEEDLRLRVFNVVLGREGLEADPGVIRDLVDLYRSTPGPVEPYPDVPDALAFWAQRLPLGLITDGYGPTQRGKVEALGLARHFRAIVYTDDLGAENTKPSDVPFRRVQEAIGFTGSAVYVGDHPGLDVPAPKRLGWTAVRIMRPGAKQSSAESDPACPPDHVIRGLDELRSLPPLEPLAGAAGSE